MAARLVVSFATPLTGSRDVTITNGTSAVSLSISGGASVALRPKDAWDVAVALLNAAANVRLSAFILVT